MRRTVKKSTSNKNLFFKSMGNGLVGLPLSYLLNIIIVIPLVIVFVDYPAWLLAAIIAVPFFIISVFRMYTIDYFWFKHKINIDPFALLEDLYERMKNPFNDED